MGFKIGSMGSDLDLIENHARLQGCPQFHEIIPLPKNVT